jgi:hypothetical protein
MMGWLLNLLGGGVLGKIADAAMQTARLAAEKRISEEEARARIARSAYDLLASEAKAASGVIIAESRSESWLTRTWRPLVAISFALVVLFYALVLPIAVGWFGLPPVKVGDALLGWVMQAVMLALGGYIGGRSAEKIARIIMTGKTR